MCSDSLSRVQNLTLSLSAAANELMLAYSDCNCALLRLFLAYNDCSLYWQKLLLAYGHCRYCLQKSLLAEKQSWHVMTAFTICQRHPDIR